MKLNHILQSTLSVVNLELDVLGSDALKRGARFWVGREAGTYNKEKCIAALTRTVERRCCCQSRAASFVGERAPDSGHLQTLRSYGSRRRGDGRDVCPWLSPDAAKG